MLWRQTRLEVGEDLVGMDVEKNNLEENRCRTDDREREVFPEDQNMHCLKIRNERVSAPFSADPD